jgi:hypothetical protein
VETPAPITSATLPWGMMASSDFWIAWWKPISLSGAGQRNPRLPRRLGETS